MTVITHCFDFSFNPFVKTRIKLSSLNNQTMKIIFFCMLTASCYLTEPTKINTKVIKTDKQEIKTPIINESSELNQGN